MDKSFLQSHTWQNFQESLGRKTFRVNNQLVTKHSLPLGLNFLYAPRPFFPSEKSFKDFVDEAYKLAKKENALFLRIEPDLKSNIARLDSFQARFAARRARQAIKQSKCVQPQDTLILNLTIPEKMILENMHPKTRYNIRLAEKHGVEIKKTVNPEDVEVFWQLALETSKRDKFRYHPKNYYKKMLEAFGKGGTLQLFIAYQQDRPVAAAFFMFNGNEAIYLHGASSHYNRQSMAPYMLQWEAIKEAKKRGCTKYDFWGIAPQATTEELKNRGTEELKNKETEEQKNSFLVSKFLSSSVPKFPILALAVSQFRSARPQWASWAGITRFKTGFAPKGKIVHYPGAVELVIRPVCYKLYNLAKALVS